jgi:hypothetical protein
LTGFQRRDAGWRGGDAYSERSPNRLVMDQRAGDDVGGLPWDAVVKRGEDFGVP